METYEIFFDLAIIIMSAEFFGLLARKLKAPQVVGQIIAGLLIGPSVLGIVENTVFITRMAEIGVILLMFSAGLETNLKDLMKTGFKALLIACAGVFIPLGAGFLMASCFNGFAEVGSSQFITNIFFGTIMTATSVSITVQALREMGKLKGTVGTTILSAAIIDDVIGIVVLTFVLGMKDPSNNPVTVVWKTALFFVLAFVFGILFYKFMKIIDRRYEHHRRIPIIGLCMCFLMAYLAEKFFGIADITGAYVAGIIMCNLNDANYIARKADINSYMLFGPVFFASIGLKTEINDFNTQLLIFSVAFVLVALVSKIIGCGLCAKLLRFNFNDSFKIGVGMMTRGEVALIVAQKGLAVGVLDAKYFTSVILLIIVSSITTPLILKALYKKDPVDTDPLEA